MANLEELNLRAVADGDGRGHDPAGVDRAEGDALTACGARFAKPALARGVTFAEAGLAFLPGEGAALELAFCFERPGGRRRDEGVGVLAGHRLSNFIGIPRGAS